MCISVPSISRPTVRSHGMDLQAPGYKQSISTASTTQPALTTFSRLMEVLHVCKPSRSSPHSRYGCLRRLCGALPGASPRRPPQRLPQSAGRMSADGSPLPKCPPSRRLQQHPSCQCCVCCSAAPSCNVSRRVCAPEFPPSGRMHLHHHCRLWQPGTGRKCSLHPNKRRCCL